MCQDNLKSQIQKIVQHTNYRTVFQNKNDTRCPKKNKAVALLKQQATALFILGRPVCDIKFVRELVGLIIN